MIRSNRRADRDLSAERQRVARGQAYDEEPMIELDSEPIDFRAASESFARVRRLRRTDLQTLRLVTTHQGRRVPTIGGFLLFGQPRVVHFPDAWIQAGRFQKTDRSRIVDRSSAESAFKEAWRLTTPLTPHGRDSVENRP